MRPVLLAFAALLALAACSSTDKHTLDVRIITGLVGGAEFNRVKTEVFRTRGDSNYALAQAEAVAYFGPAYSRGVRVASFPEFAAGDYTVRVTLMQPNGTKLIEQPLRFMLTSDFTATVHLDRGCVAVECPNPGGSAALAACLQGTCVDPRCNPEDPATLEYCPSTLCENDAQCSTTSTCATSYCASGICVTEQIPSGEGACAEGEWCNPVATENACQDVPDTTLPIDAGVDGGSALCGRICQGTPTACVTGFYWDCEGGEPVCTPFIFAPNGTSCGEDGESCDGIGVCEAAPTCEIEDPIELINDGSDHDATELQNGAKIAYFRADHEPDAPVTVTMEVLTPDVCSADPDNSTRVFDATNWNENTDVRVLWTRDGLVTGTRECRVRVLAPCATPIEAVVRIRDVDFERLTLQPDGSELSDSPASFADLPSPTVLSDDGRYIYVSVGGSAAELATTPDFGRTTNIYRFDRTREIWQHVPTSQLPLGGLPSYNVDVGPVHHLIQAIDSTGTRIAYLELKGITDRVSGDFLGYDREFAVCDVSGLDSLEEGDMLPCTPNLYGSFIEDDGPPAVVGTQVDFLDRDHIVYAGLNIDDGSTSAVLVEITEVGEGAERSLQAAERTALTPAGVDVMYAGASPSGRYVAFISRERGLDDAGDDVGIAANEGLLYLLDRTEGTTTLVGSAYIEEVGDDGFDPPELWGVLNVQFTEGEAGFISLNINAGDSEGFDPTTSGVFHYDIARSTLTALSDEFTGLPSSPVFPAFVRGTRSGRYITWTGIVFSATGSDLSFTGMDVYIGDTRTGEWRAASNFDELSPPAGISVFSSITNDGRFVVFPTTADSLATGDSNGQFDLLLGAAFD